MSLEQVDSRGLPQCFFSEACPSLASFAVVRNEERFLREHLLYHRALGVSRCYLFLDRCTDKSEQIALSCPWVRIIDAPRDLAKPSNISSHQILCSGIALNLARNDSVDWLMHIDPDEFAFGQHGNQLSQLGHDFLERGELSALEVEGHLGAMLGEIPGEVQQVILQTRETAPIRYDANQPFWQHDYFQVNLPISRNILNPLTGRLECLDRWLGHNRGKAIIRVTADVAPYDPHQWGCAKSSVPLASLPETTIKKGWHYHYVVTSGAHWKEKYSKFHADPDVWLNGTAMPFPRVAWKHASSRFGVMQAQAYFSEWICLPEGIVESARKESILEHDSRPAQLINRVLASAN
jgi:hypothetical protein